MENQQYIDVSFVKQHADFEKVLGYYNLKPTGRGKQLSVLCPDSLKLPFSDSSDNRG